MRRALALLAAAFMIAGSLIVRSRLDRDGQEASATRRLVCSEELAPACQQLADRLDVTTEPAGTTADRLATVNGDPGLDGWLVPDPWPDIVDARRQAAALPTLFQSRQRLARSPLVLVVWNERATALSTRCAGEVTWRCLGDAAAAGPWTASRGRPEWGQVKPGHASPATDAVGLLVLGHAVAGWFGRADLSTGDLDADDAFARWFSALERAVPVPGLADSPLLQMVRAGPSVYDAVGTTEAEAGPLLVQASRRSELNVLYPSPMATADVVLATAATGSAAASLKRLAAGDEARRALAGIGWRVPGVASAPGVSDTPALPPTSGLPPAGLLDALRARWREVTGR